MVSLELVVTVATRATVRAEGDPREGGTLKLLGNGKLTAEFDTDCGATREILKQVEYTLTKLGQTLLAPVRVLAVWAQGHRGDVMKARVASV